MDDKQAQALAQAAERRLAMLTQMNSELFSQLDAYADQLAETLSEIAPLEAHAESLRSSITDIVVALGGKAHSPALGQLQMTNQVEIRSYDTKKIDQLVLALRDDEQYAKIVEVLEDALKVSVRKGSLRITRDR